MCDIKKCEKILRSALTFVGARLEIMTVQEKTSNSSEAVIWHDGKGYTYWQAAAEILKEANEFLRSDLEKIGVKLDKMPDNLDINKTNQSIFQFNDTDDSISIHHSKNQTSQQIKIVENSDDNCELEDANKLDVQVKTSSEQIDCKISNQIKALKIDDLENKNVIHNLTDKNSLETDLFIDDHVMIKAVETFEKAKSSSVKEITSKNSSMNTTVVSQEVLKMCYAFEKKILTGSKPNETSNECAEIAKKSIKYSIVENALESKNNSSKSDYIDNDELKRIFVTQAMPSNALDCVSKEKLEISEVFRTLNLTSFDINIIGDLNELVRFCQKVRNVSNANNVNS